MVVHFDGIPICHIQFMPVMNGRWKILCEGKTRLLLRRQFPFEFVGKILLWRRHVRVVKKKCFSCAWKKEQASGVRVLSSAHCINELCKHQRTFDLQNASMKGVMFVYPASHVMGVPSSRQLVSRIPIMDFQSHDYRNDAAIIIILFWTFLIVSNSPELSVDSHTW